MCLLAPGHEPPARGLTSTYDPRQPISFLFQMQRAAEDSRSTVAGQRENPPDQTSCTDQTSAFSSLLTAAAEEDKQDMVTDDEEEDDMAALEQLMKGMLAERCSL